MRLLEARPGAIYLGEGGIRSLLAAPEAVPGGGRGTCEHSQMRGSQEVAANFVAGIGARNFGQNVPPLCGSPVPRQDLGQLAFRDQKRTPVPPRVLGD